MTCRSDWSDVIATETVGKMEKYGQVNNIASARLSANSDF